MPIKRAVFYIIQIISICSITRSLEFNNRLKYLASCFWFIKGFKEKASNPLHKSDWKMFPMRFDILLNKLSKRDGWGSGKFTPLTSQWYIKIFHNERRLNFQRLTLLLLRTVVQLNQFFPFLLSRKPEILYIHWSSAKTVFEFMITDPI